MPPLPLAATTKNSAAAETSMTRAAAARDRAAAAALRCTRPGGGLAAAAETENGAVGRPLGRMERGKVSFRFFDFFLFFSKKKMDEKVSS